MPSEITILSWLRSVQSSYTKSQEWNHPDIIDFKFTCGIWPLSYFSSFGDWAFAFEVSASTGLQFAIPHKVPQEGTLSRKIDSLTGVLIRNPCFSCISHPILVHRSHVFLQNWSYFDIVNSDYWDSGDAYQAMYLGSTQAGRRKSWEQELLEEMNMKLMDWRLCFSMQLLFS